MNMVSRFPLYWIPLLPLLGAVFNLLVGRMLRRRIVALIACASVFSAFIISMVATWLHLFPLWQAWVKTGGPEAVLQTRAAPALIDPLFQWISAGPIHINLGLYFDPLSAVMVGIITFIGFLIHVYSTGYMHSEPDYARFFGYLNLFTGVMLLLVLGDNLVVLFLGWEGVGLCSYLLIGFWYDRDGTVTSGDANATAGRKAFIVNRIGDFAFLLGIFLLFWSTGTLALDELPRHADNLLQLYRPLGIGPISVGAVIALLFFIGATGKSAQIPLYVWLPDAMAGPTPVSALIHAATMVTAGVYMIARLNFIYLLSPAVMGIVALVGAITALFAATIGLAQNDIKKVLAYSTISQLGYMFIAVGVGAFAAGVFHLFTHAFFKACLFLGAGSVIHAMSGKQDIREMGGLARPLPTTHWTFLISCLAISGLPVFSGFFSKDEILWKALITTNPAWPSWFPGLLYSLALAAAWCTAFYMFRLYYLVFSGTNRAAPEIQHHLHESPLSMTWPLKVLAIGAAIIGFIGLPALFAVTNWFHYWLSPVVERGRLLSTETHTIHTLSETGWAHHHGAEAGVMFASVIVSLAGLGLARRYYRSEVSPKVKALVAYFPRLTRLVANKYYVDEIYHAIILRPIQKTAFILWRFIDVFLIDLMLANWCSIWLIDAAGRISRRLQDGNTQRYLAGLIAGLVLMIIYVASPPNTFVIRPDRRVKVGESVIFDARQAGTDEARILEYQWDFDGDGKWDTVWSSRSVATHVYQQKKIYQVQLQVRDQRWHTIARSLQSVEVE